MPRDFTASGGSEAPLRSTGHAWSTISQMASPVPRADGVSSLRMAKNDELSSESDAIESTEGTTLAARFQALRSVAESISSCREPEERFGRLAAELQRVVRFDFVGASCYDHERGVVRGAMLETGSTALVPREEMVAKETPHAIVIASQQPLIVSDTGAETRWPERMAMIRNDGIGSFCVLPLTTIHTRLGTLGFARRDRATYTDAEVQFMGEVAKLVAVAIENAMAFGEIGRLHRRHRPEDRPLPSGRRRHAVPRRGRRDPARAPAEAAARPAGAGVRADRQYEDDQGRRPPHRRDEPRPPSDGGRATVPGRSLLPAERVPDPCPAAPRAARGHSCLGELLRPAARASHEPPGGGHPERDAGRAPSVRLAREHPRAREPDRARDDPLRRPDAPGAARRPHAAPGSGDDRPPWHGGPGRRACRHPARPRAGALGAGRPAGCGGASRHEADDAPVADEATRDREARLILPPDAR